MRELTEHEVEQVDGGFFGLIVWAVRGVTLALSIARHA